MFVLLFVLFVAVPILELALLVWIGGEMGVLPTVALVFVTGIVGAALARWQGLSVLRRLREELHGGTMPAGTMFEGVLLLVAGAFLVTPGVLTDAVGFALLVPPVRRWVGRIVRAWAGRRFRVVTVVPGAPGRSGDPPMKDAEVTSVRDAEEAP